MSNQKFPLSVTLKDDRTGETIEKGTIKTKYGSCTFKEVPAGRYTAFGLFADKTQVKPLRSRFYTTTTITYYVSGFFSSGLGASPENNARVHLADRPPVKTIVSSAIGLSLFGNLSATEPVLKEFARNFWRPQSVKVAARPKSVPQTTRLGNTRFLYSNKLSAAVEEKLRQCLKSNFETLSGIPTLSGLLESLEWEPIIEGEFEHEILEAYTLVKQLQATIEDCDPTLGQEIVLAIEESTPQQNKRKVFISGSLVNVRASPNAQAAILSQVSAGTELSIDQDTTYSLSDTEKNDIQNGRGWQPVILPSGELGYIYSLYVRSER